MGRHESFTARFFLGLETSIMAEVFAFRGYRYNTAIAGEVGKLIAPPYDVIDSPLRDALFRLSDHNVARITRADRQRSADAGNPYESAAACWADWRARDVVTQDERPTIYVYEQFFEARGRKFSRAGMIVLVRLENLGEGVLPHETTLPRAREDRLQLMRATRAQFGQVFGLYPDSEKRVDHVLQRAKTEPPLIRAGDPWDLHHRLWALTDSDAIAEVQDAMRGKEILIADGHHRYETALAYSKERPDCEAAGFRMMTLVNTANPGLLILPIHRRVKNVSGFEPKALLDALRKNFQVHSYPGQSAAVRTAALDAIRAHQAAGRHAFVLFMGNGNYHTVVLKREELLDGTPGRSEATRRLDVTILHNLILEQELGVTAEHLRAQTNVEYVQDFPHAIQEAADHVCSGQGQALFLLNATRVEEVQAAATDRERMPQKSTFFYPKVYSGLVFYCMD